MKILYLTIDMLYYFATTYELMMTALNPYCELTFYGPRFDVYNKFNQNRDILKVIEHIYGNDEPDVIIMWDIEGSGWAGDFTNLDKVDCLKVLWSVDIQNDAVPKRVSYLQKAEIDLILMTYDEKQETVPSKFFKDKLGVPLEFYPFSVAHDIFRPLGLSTKYDVSLVGNMSSSYYPLRNSVHEALKDKGLNYHHPGRRTYVRELFARHINESKICITGSSSYKYLVQKYYEITACGTLLLADNCMDAEYQGFVPGENFVEISADNVVEKVEYYLNNPDQAQVIAQRGRDLILERHTHDIRARELMEILHKYV